MTILGVLLLLAGGAGALLYFMGMAPEQLANTPLSFGVCAAVAAAGLVLIVLNRRPAN